jgi:hypothetical protein
MSTRLKLQVEWLLENNQDVYADIKGITALQLQALEDIKIKTFRILFDQKENLEAMCELVPQELMHGPRSIPGQHLSGSARVKGFQTILAMALGEPLAHSYVQSPADYWQWTGTIHVPKGHALGLVVRSLHPTTCRAMMGGQ